MRKQYRSCLAWALLCCLVLPAFAALPGPPNVILILADDLGYSDVGCFGGEIATPALDRLAREGVRLTRFHNGGMCVVSRASMLTGQWWPRSLPAFEHTRLLSEELQAAGYRTALIGKWHLKGNPMDRGFDHFFGFLGGFSDHFAGSPDYRLDRRTFKDFGTNYYSTDAFTDRAIQFIQTATTGQSPKPFFLYLSYQAPHNPLQSPPEDIRKYRGKYLSGWQAIREVRFRRQQEMGIVPATATLPAYPQNLPDWNSLTLAQRDLEDLRMSVFAAMIERMDGGIGRLLTALKQSGQADNTLVLFLSDNGADSFSVLDQAMLKQNRLPGDRGSNWQLGTGWAYASVTPWRLYKISQHAGGVTTGAIAWWPGGLGKAGRIESSAVHMIDLLPTLLELAGRSPNAPKTAVSSSATAGESFLPLLLGQSWQRKQPLYFQYMDNRSIRTDHWTLVEVDGAGWELFQTDRDPLETENLAAQNRAVVADLNDRWLKWWCDESGEPAYQSKSTRTSPHYKPQGDRGSGIPYQPSAMPGNFPGGTIPTIKRGQKVDSDSADRPRG